MRARDIDRMARRVAKKVIAAEVAYVKTKRASAIEHVRGAITELLEEDEEVVEEHLADYLNEAFEDLD